MPQQCRHRRRAPQELLLAAAAAAAAAVAVLLAHWAAVRRRPSGPAGKHPRYPGAAPTQHSKQPQRQAPSIQLSLSDLFMQRLRGSWITQVRSCQMLKRTPQLHKQRLGTPSARALLVQLPYAAPASFKHCSKGTLPSGACYSFFVTTALPVCRCTAAAASLPSPACPRHNCTATSGWPAACPACSQPALGVPCLRGRQARRSRARLM